MPGIHDRQGWQQRRKVLPPSPSWDPQYSPEATWFVTELLTWREGDGVLRQAEMPLKVPEPRTPSGFATFTLIFHSLTS